MTTKKELEAKLALAEKIIAKQEKLQKKSEAIQEEVSLKLSKDKWQTLSGHYGNQVSLAPFQEGGKFKSPAITVKMTQSATKEGFDKIRAELDIAENKLDKAGILTA